MANYWLSAGQSLLCMILISTDAIFCNEHNDSHGADYLTHTYEINDNYIYNLSAKVIYNHSMDMLQYHISWQVDSPETVTVTVISDCAGIHLQEHVNGTMVRIPQYNDGSFILEADCSYEIIVNDSVGHTAQMKHTIPVCVGHKCDCTKWTMRANITVDNIESNTALVEWDFPDDDNVAMFKDIAFSMYLPKEVCTNAPKQNETTVPDHSFVRNNSARVNFDGVDEACLIINITSVHDCYDVYVKPLKKSEDLPRDSTWISSTVILVILLLVIIAFWYIDQWRGTIKAILISRVFRRRRRASITNIYGNVTNRAKRIETNLLYVEKEILEGHTDTYELPRNHLELLCEIGKGAFGEVYLGKAFIGGKEARVAVKTLRAKSSKEEMEDFLSEIDIMKKIGRHLNIVTMLKSCTLQEPYMMVMEYLPFGDLKHYLVNLREKWNNKRNDALEIQSNGSASYIVPNSPRTPNSPTGKKTRPSTSTEYTNLSVTPTSLDDFVFDLEQVLDHTELQNFALQIASGMAHLEKIPITHRDLAARNILIDEKKVLKISDFGLSRPGPYINKSHNKLPLRWMALEAIEDHLYDNKSDVWSFGIVLWEIGTLGAFPYEDVPDRMLIHHLQMGKRLPRPEICTDELYTLMLRCWSADPTLRPTFAELIQQLDVTKSRIYIDFTQLNPLYVFPPTQSQNKYQIKRDATNTPKYLECQ